MNQTYVFYPHGDCGLVAECNVFINNIVEVQDIIECLMEEVILDLDLEGGHLEILKR